MKCPILMYHYIGEPIDPEDAPYFVSEKKFEEQMRFIHKRGFHSLNLEELMDGLYEGGELPKNSIVITFDDGHLSFFEKAAPVLKKYGLKATLFVITDRIGQPNFMNWDQIKSVGHQGVSIESHSVTHRILAQLELDEVEMELVESKSTLEKHLGREVDFFCYRGGHYNDAIKSMVSSSGYNAAVCSRFGYNDPQANRFELRRIPVRGGDDIDIFGAKVHGMNWQSYGGKFLAKYWVPVKNALFG